MMISGLCRDIITNDFSVSLSFIKRKKLVHLTIILSVRHNTWLKIVVVWDLDPLPPSSG